MEGFQYPDELITEAVLERHTLRGKPTRHHQHFFVFDIDTLDRPDSFREIENFWLAERFGCEPTLVLLPHDGRVEALFDGRPDTEAGGEDFVAFVVEHSEVRAIACTKFIDFTEQVVNRVSGENIRQSGLDTNSHEGQTPGRLPFVVSRELFVTELHARFRIRLGWVGLRQTHRHVEIICTRRDRARKNRLNKLRFDGVHDMRRAVTASHFGDDLRIRCVNRIGNKP